MSKIKNKNIINFLGRPIISYTIDLLKKTGIFEKIHVSTDSKKIVNLSKKSACRPKTSPSGKFKLVIDTLGKSKLLSSVSSASWLSSARIFASLSVGYSGELGWLFSPWVTLTINI